MEFEIKRLGMHVLQLLLLYNYYLFGMLGITPIIYSETHNLNYQYTHQIARLETLSFIVFSASIKRGICRSYLYRFDQV